MWGPSVWSQNPPPMTPVSSPYHFHRRPMLASSFPRSHSWMTGSGQHRTVYPRHGHTAPIFPGFNLRRIPVSLPQYILKRARHPKRKNHIGPPQVMRRPANRPLYRLGARDLLLSHNNGPGSWSWLILGDKTGARRVRNTMRYHFTGGPQACHTGHIEAPGGWFEGGRPASYLQPS